MDPMQSPFEDLVLHTVRREASLPESPHPSYSDLVAAAGGALSQEQMDEVIVHAFGCPTCRAALMRASATIDREVAGLQDVTHSESFVEAWRRQEASKGGLSKLLRGIRTLASTPRRRVAVLGVVGVAAVLALLVLPPTSILRWVSRPAPRIWLSGPAWKIESAAIPRSRIVAVGTTVAMYLHAAEVRTSTGSTDTYPGEIEAFADDAAIALILEVDPLPTQLGIELIGPTGQELTLGEQSLEISPCRVTIPRSELPLEAGPYDLILRARGHGDLEGSLHATLVLRAQSRDR